MDLHVGIEDSGIEAFTCVYMKSIYHIELSTLSYSVCTC